MNKPAMQFISLVFTILAGIKFSQKSNHIDPTAPWPCHEQFSVLKILTGGELRAVGGESGSVHGTAAEGWEVGGFFFTTDSGRHVGTAVGPKGTDGVTTTGGMELGTLDRIGN